ncbi:MAG: flagellar motor stator protein MotA [Kangiellaceae bacterium]|jgi:chemotaxis protein MotA|nr:flagellar motor stator protein MotA [Kangiellaceae bacterium]
MPVLIGAIIVLAAVLGGYVLSHGSLLALWQPFELLIIGGAALGAFIIANPSKVTLEVARKLPGLLSGSKYTKLMYLELLAMMYDLFGLMRKDGLIAVEQHIEDPKSSNIFTKYPLIRGNHHAIEFICDYLRLMIVGDMTAYELENLMDAELDTHHHESIAPGMALGKVADALPGFGIVAAVLGIVITMESLGGPPEEIGYHVAAALVGTFLGILLAYGFVGPLAQALEHRADEESKMYECIKACIIATVNGVPPQVAIEFGRKTLYSKVRPGFQELEARVRGR